MKSSIFPLILLLVVCFSLPLLFKLSEGFTSSPPSTTRPMGTMSASTTRPMGTMTMPPMGTMASPPMGTMTNMPTSTTPSMTLTSIGFIKPTSSMTLAQTAPPLTTSPMTTSPMKTIPPLTTQPMTIPPMTMPPFKTIPPMTIPPMTMTPMTVPPMTMSSMPTYMPVASTTPNINPTSTTPGAPMQNVNDIMDKVTPILNDLINKASPILNELSSNNSPAMNDLINKASPILNELSSNNSPSMNDLINKASPILNVVTQNTTSPQKTTPRQKNTPASYLTDKTNTSYDDYLDKNILKNGESASAYMRRATVDPTNSAVDQKIEENINVLDYFMNIFKSYSEPFESSVKLTDTETNKTYELAADKEIFKKDGEISIGKHDETKYNDLLKDMKVKYEELKKMKPEKCDEPIKCIADFGTNIGEDLCCGQTGVLQDTRYVCPSNKPTCGNFKCGSKFGSCT